MTAERGHHGTVSIGSVEVASIKSFSFDKPLPKTLLTKKEKKALKHQRARLKVKRNSR